MKHIILSRAWEYVSGPPLPVYRVRPHWWHNKQEHEFLLVRGVTPMAQYTVTADYGKIILYAGMDKATAWAEKVRYDAEQTAKTKNSSHYWMPPADLQVNLPILPEGKFCVVKTRKKGALVVSGEDSTDRCLLFVGRASGFHGGVDIIEDYTTGVILKRCLCSVGNNYPYAIEVIALLEVGQTIVFYTFSRCVNEVCQFTWNGAQMEKRIFSSAEPIVEDVEAL